MNLDLKEKVVIVTGGSKGIGLACARAFLAEGGRVAIVSRSRVNLDEAMQNLAAPKEDLIDPLSPERRLDYKPPQAYHTPLLQALQAQKYQ